MSTTSKNDFKPPTSLFDPKDHLVCLMCPNSFVMWYLLELPLRRNAHAICYVILISHTKQIFHCHPIGVVQRNDNNTLPSLSSPPIRVVLTNSKTGVAPVLTASLTDTPLMWSIGQNHLLVTTDWNQTVQITQRQNT